MTPDLSERNLRKIADKAKYLSEPAWTVEGCAVVGRQIHEWAVEALDALPPTRGAVSAERTIDLIERVYERTMPGPQDALRDRVLTLIAEYRASRGAV